MKINKTKTQTYGCSFLSLDLDRFALVFVDSSNDKSLRLIDIETGHLSKKNDYFGKGMSPNLNVYIA
jgi:hypothetical protein